MIPVCDEDINVTVVIIIAKGGGATCFTQCEAFSHLCCDIRKFSIPQIPKKPVLLWCRRRPIDLGDVIHRMSVCDEYIFVPVVIVIKETDTPTEIAMCMLSDPSRNCGINEKVVTFVVIEGIRLVLEIADCEIQLAVIVIVCEGDSHSGFCFSHIAAADTGEQPHLFKSAVPPVLEEEVKILIVGNVDVSITIVITISNRNAKTVRSRDV